jgi:3-methyladenine DNA glycosylase/8-oxoguanine DNA glycosylase
MLALDDDTSEFHRRFARDPLLGPTVQRLRGMRTRRKATVTHAVIRAVAGQLIQASKALAIERAIIRGCGEDPPTARRSQASLPLDSRDTARREPGRDAGEARPRSRPRRAAAEARCLARSSASEGVGPWTVGVVALQGLGRYDAGLVDDLALVKLLASLRRRWPEPGETASSSSCTASGRARERLLLQGFKRGSCPARAWTGRGSCARRHGTPPENRS